VADLEFPLLGGDRVGELQIRNHTRPFKLPVRL
jgi:hypothetical protein